MATPRKPRPSFDAPVPATPATPATPAASAWAYRTDQPGTPSSTPRSTPSVLTRLITTPVMLTALIVLMPLSWLARPSKPR